MNIIERLGGYERLKPHFVLTDRAIGYTHIYLHGNNHYCFLDESVDYIIPDRAILIKDVFDALLEYRRQHNIFEVGDIAVNSRGDESRLLKIWRVDVCAHNSKMSIADYDAESLGGWSRFHALRHATDAEIKAGKRL